MKNILQDFADNHSPEYNLEEMYPEEMDKLVERNLSGRILRSPYLRLLISWIIVAPLSYLLIILSIYATQFLYNVFRLERFLGSFELFFTRFLPALIGLSTLDIVILFLIPNLILGYLSPNTKIGFLSSILQVVITIIFFFNSMEPIFAFIIVGYLPLAVIFSLFFLFLGLRLSSRKFLKS